MITIELTETEAELIYLATHEIKQRWDGTPIANTSTHRAVSENYQSILNKIQEKYNQVKNSQNEKE